MVPALDFYTDVFVALPACLHHGLLESFEVQLVSIVFSTLFGYGNLVIKEGRWGRVARFPEEARLILLLGGLIMYPLLPIFPFIGSCISYAKGDKAQLQGMMPLVRAIAEGEVIQVPASLSIQGSAYFSFGVDDISVSLSSA